MSEKLKEKLFFPHFDKKTRSQFRPAFKKLDMEMYGNVNIPLLIFIIIQGYPQRMRRRRRLYGNITTACFSYIRIPSNCTGISLLPVSLILGFPATVREYHYCLFLLY